MASTKPADRPMRLAPAVLVSVLFAGLVVACSDIPLSPPGDTPGGDEPTILVALGATDLVLTKSFTDDPVAPGDQVTLRFTLRNTSTTDTATALNFIDSLSNTLGGLEALSSQPAVPCGPGSQLFFGTGDDFISLGNPAFPGSQGGTLVPGASCTFSVTLSVPSTAATGTYLNTTTPVRQGTDTVGVAATDNLVVAELGFSKAFVDDPVAAGENVTLQFTITNHFGTKTVSLLSFSDNLDATLSGMTIPTQNLSTPCGAGSSLTVLSATVSLVNGSLPPGASCTFDIVATVPAGASTGTYPNTTDVLMGSLPNEDVVTGGPATDDLQVGGVGFTKSFTDDPVQPGEQVTLEFTLQNADPANAATGLTFTDDLDAVLSGLAATGLPATDVCGTGSTLSGTSTLTLTGGSLPAAVPIIDPLTGEISGFEGSCTFSVTLDVPAGVGGGAYLNTTSTLDDANENSWNPASAVLLVVSPPVLTKSFVDDPVGPGGTVALEFTITNPNPTAAQQIAFTDDLGQGTLPAGLTATSLPAAGFCGPGSQLAGSTSLAMTGDILGPGASCTFRVGVAVPAGTAGGSYTNTTGAVTAEVGVNDTGFNGRVETIPVAVSGVPASDDLKVVAVGLAKSFTDDPVAPGGTGTMQFTLTNTGGTSATDLGFTDDLRTMFALDVTASISPLVPTNLPLTGIDACGGTMEFVKDTITFTTPIITTDSTRLILSGGSLAAGTSCLITVDFEYRSDGPSGTHLNTTSTLTGKLGGVDFETSPAADILAVATDLEFSKSFINNPVPAGGTATLRFAIELGDEAPASATNITFTDDLEAVLTGLVATGLPANDVCGSGSSLSGTSTLTLTGGTVAPGSSCQFDVPVQIPTGAAPGTYTNVTSQLGATVGSLPVLAQRAESDLVVQGFTFAKSFIGDPVVPGETVILRFTIANLRNEAVSSIAFTDNVAQKLAGLAVATGGLPAGGFCGPVSQITGTSVLSMTDGSLAASGSAGDSCTFDVTLQVPTGPVTGDYSNVTSTLTGTITSGTVTAGPAKDILEVVVPVTLAKSFTDDPVEPGDQVTLQFTIANSHPTDGATNVGFSDDLDAVLSGLEATGLPANDFCGAGSQITGTGVLSMTGGSLGAAGSGSETCVFNVTLQVPADASPGTYTNVTSTLSAQFGTNTVTGEAASDVLVVEPTSTVHDGEGPVTINVVSTPNPVEVGSNPVTLTANVDDTNTGGSTIRSAEYRVDSQMFMPMTAADSDFNEVSEDVTAEITSVADTVGVYEICVRGTDSSGNTGAEECIMLAVYDPDGGFVTGGGWIYSEPGAYTPDPLAKGKANFGFVSKYKKGASVPTGNTEFNFKAGDLNFHSSSYDFLVVTGNNFALFKGSGTINGEQAPNDEDFKFQIWAGDGDPDDPDTFRIKIWWEDGLLNENVVYDNGFDQEIGGGNIVIHTK